MTVPLIILAVLSLVGGYVGVSPALSSLVGIHTDNKFEHFLEPAIAKVGEHSTATHPGASLAPVMAQAESHSAVASAQAASEGGHDVETERLFTAVSSVLALLGLAFGLVFFKRNPLWRAPKLLEDKYRVDEFYDATVVGPVENLSRDGLWKVVDVKIIDGFVNGVARLFAALAGALRHTQTGFARNYAAVILLGAIIVIGYFILTFFNIRNL